MKSILILSFLLFNFTINKVEAKTCQSLFIKKQSFSKKNKFCISISCQTNELIMTTYKVLNKSLPGNSKAYLTITSVMIGTSALTAYLSLKFNTDTPMLSHFLSTFLGSVTTIGIFVVGSPIWEPLQSFIRSRAFKLFSDLENRDVLEKQYFDTNIRLSINAQMSRNIFRDYIKTASQSFHVARTHLNTDHDYSIEQIAEIIIRLHELFPDVDPSNKTIVRSIQSTFYTNLENPSQFRNQIAARLKDMDPETNHQKTLEAWFY